MNDYEQFKKQIKQRLKQTQQEFMQESDGKTQCEIGRQGRDTPLSLKQIEGRMQALQDLDRIFSRRTDSTNLFKDLLIKLHEKWQALPDSSSHWRMYRSSGLEEIRRLISQLPG